MFLGRDGSGNNEKMAEELLIAIAGIGQFRDGFFRNHQPAAVDKPGGIPRVFSNRNPHEMSETTCAVAFRHGCL